MNFFGVSDSSQLLINFKMCVHLVFKDPINRINLLAIILKVNVNTCAKRRGAEYDLVVETFRSNIFYERLYLTICRVVRGDHDSRNVPP